MDSTKPRKLQPLQSGWGHVGVVDCWQPPELGAQGDAIWAVVEPTVEALGGLVAAEVGTDELAVELGH